MKKAVFLDRDGVIIEQVAYLSSPDQVALVPGAAEALRIIHQHGDAAVVVSNQSGVGRGFFTVGAVDAAHARIQELLTADGERVDAYYYCTHRPEDECSCRKPHPELVLRAGKELGLDVSASAMVGDRPSDLECGRNAGCAVSILVLTGYGKKYADEAVESGFAVTENFLEAVRLFYRMNPSE